MARLLPKRVVLYAVNLFFALLLALFFLPVSLAKILGIAVAFALVVMVSGGRTSADGDSGSPARRLRGWLLAAGLILFAIVQAAVLYAGFANPFRLRALPGSTVFVDGTFFIRTPDLAGQDRKKDLPSPENIRPWLTPRETCHYLRWDAHEIRITKKWYVTADRSQESAQTVWIDLAKLGKPGQAFAQWQMTSELKALFKIDYGIGPQAADTPANSPGSAVSSAFNESDFRNIVEQWDEIWTKAMDQKDIIGPKRTDPYLAAIQIVSDRSTPHLDFQIRDWTGRSVKPLRPIRPIREQTPTADGSMPNPLTSLREDVFGQLLAELGIPEKINLLPATAEVAELALRISSDVDTLLETPQAGTTNITRTLAELEKLATIATQNGQLEVAVTAQQQITAALLRVATASNPERRTGLVSELQTVRNTVEKAIQEKSGKGRVYLHLSDESQRAPAEKVAEKLKAAGFVIASTYNIGGRAQIPSMTEVRFFTYPEPATTKQSADAIVELLKTANAGPARTAYIIPSERDRERSSDIATHFEIWFARDSFQTAL
jgi:hypothetical protein